MATITYKIDKRTRAGKAFLAMTESFLREVDGIEIIKNVTESLKKENPYNPEFVAKIKKAEAEIKKGKTTRLNPKDILGSLGLK